MNNNNNNIITNNQDSNNNHHDNNHNSNSIGSLLDAQTSDSNMVQMPTLDSATDIEISCGDDIK